MQLAILSPDLAKRLVTDVKELLPFHSHADHLRAVATQYGFPSWESLLKACSSTPPTFIYDQDLDENAFQGRRLDQAKLCRDVLGIPLPYAHEFAHLLAATRDFRRQRRVIYVPDLVFEREMLNENDLWWSSSTEMEHPLCPPGFSLAEALDVRDTAKLRLDPSPNRIKGNQMFHIFPGVYAPNHRYRKLNSHFYGARERFLEVEAVAPAFMFESGYRVTQGELDKGAQRFHGLEYQQIKSRVSETRKQYGALLDAAGFSDKEREMLPQIPVAVRDRLGIPWYWPLVPIISSPTQVELWKEVEEYARAI